MLSPVASTSSAPEPKMYSATYVENYLDSVENLPNEVQRFLSRIREIDMKYQGRRLYFGDGALHTMPENSANLNVWLG